MIQQAELAAPAAAEEQGVWSIGGGSLLLCGHGRPSICLPSHPSPLQPLTTPHPHPPWGRSRPMMRSCGCSSAVYTSKLAGLPDSGCTLTPHSEESRPNASSARFCLLGRGRAGGWVNEGYKAAGSHPAWDALAGQ